MLRIEIVERDRVALGNRTVGRPPKLIEIRPTGLLRALLRQAIYRLAGAGGLDSTTRDALIEDGEYHE